jgi:hypothetical protein
MGSILSHVVDLDFHPLDNNILCHCHYCISTILPTSSHSCTVIWHNMNKFNHWVSENQMVGFIFFISLMIHLKTPSNFKYKRQLHSEKMRFRDIRFTIHKMGARLSLTKNGTKNHGI